MENFHGVQHHDTRDALLESRAFVREDLWLARYTRRGKCLRWYRYWDFSNVSSGPTLTSGATQRPSYETIKTSHEMQRLLLEQDEDILHQFVLLGIPYDQISSDEISDIVGFGLDATFNLGLRSISRAG
jgi:hypothetical protein